MKQVRSTKKPSRDSGVELLRILCIFAILANHHVVLSPWMDALGLDHDSLTPGKAFLQCFGMFGRTACSGFLLITGYYSCKSVRPGHFRRMVPLAVHAVFWSAALYFLLPLLFGVDTFHYRPHSWIYVFFPFLSGGGIWFVTQYIVFWCFLPVVNPMLRTLPEKRFRLLFLLFFVFWILPGTFLPSRLQPEWSFGNMSYFFFLYSVGAYLRFYPPETKTPETPDPRSDKRKRLRCAVWALAAVGAMTGSVLAFDAMGIALKNDALIRHAMHFCIESSLLSVFCAIAVFLFFRQLRFRSSVVNWVASSVLGIYLIHALCPPHFIWSGFSPIPLHADGLAAHAFAKCSAVFVYCLALDKIRHYTIGWLGRRLFDRLWPQPCR